MAEGEFKFRQVKICKDQVLGQGAYGIVYRAKCDGLVCAAKYLYPTFFISNDPGANRIAGQFRRECALLSRLKHPNIVQYLGTYDEDGLDSVVLLMELLDTSLHSYLGEHEASPLPFHLEINICHDVSLAIDYLHANNIHHRDLSCKNILLLGDFRAKVSDFGISRLRDPKSNYSSNTPCPGNILYMPPEVLKVPPDLTETLDEFSFGVVMIQILSRSEPQPTALHQGNGEMQLLVLPEIERRKRDIDLCDPGNPILQIAVSCISNNPLERPSSEKLCQLFFILKETSQYKKSLSDSSKDKQEVTGGSPNSLYDFVVVEMSEGNQYFTSKIESLQRLIKDKDEQLKEKDRHLSLRNQQLLLKQKEIEDSLKEVKAKEAEISQKDQILLAHVDQLSNKEVEIIGRNDELAQLKQLLSDKEAEIVSKDRQLREKEEQLAKKEAIICAQRDRQTSIDENYSVSVNEIELLKQELASKNHELEELQTNLAICSNGVSSPPTPSPIRPKPVGKTTPIPKRPKALELSWRNGRQAPVSFQPQSSTIVSCQEKVYVSLCNYSRNEGKIYEYDVKYDIWTMLPVIRKSEFSLAVIDESYVVAVGGCSNLRNTGTILRLFPNSPTPNKWVKAFTDVPTARSFPLSVVVNINGSSCLLVVGGEVSGTPVPNVEVLDMMHKTWLYLRSLPRPLVGLTRMTVCTSLQFAYFVGGFEEGSLSKVAYAVNAERLVKETRTTDEKLWIFLPPLPVSGSSCVSVRNRLLAVGGFDTRAKSSSNFVYEFNQILGNWETTGRLPRSLSRGLASVATVNNKQVLVVIGGNSNDGTCSQMTHLANI